MIFIFTQPEIDVQTARGKLRNSVIPSLSKFVKKCKQTAEESSKKVEKYKQTIDCDANRGWLLLPNLLGILISPLVAILHLWQLKGKY